MKHKFLAMAMLLLGSSAFAGYIDGFYCDWFDFEANGVYYKVLDENTKVVEVTYHDPLVYPDCVDGILATPTYSGEVHIPATVEYSGATYDVVAINEYAFSENPITLVDIPASVKDLGSFYRCEKLKTIICHHAAPLSISQNMFSRVDVKNANLYVPFGSKSLYESAPYWSEFGNIVEADLDALVKQSETAEWTPIVEQWKRWTYFAEVNSQWTSEPKRLILEIGGTEVIDGKEYSYVVARLSPPNEEEPDCIIPVAYLRETPDHDVYMIGNSLGCGEVWEYLHWLYDEEEVLLYSFEHPELAKEWAQFCIPAEPYTTLDGKELEAYYDGSSTSNGMVVEGLGFLVPGISDMPYGFLLGKLEYTTGASTILQLESVTSGSGEILYWNQEVKDYADSKLGGVIEVNASAEDSGSARYYNISGQPVENPEHGVYIKVDTGANSRGNATVIMR